MCPELSRSLYDRLRLRSFKLLSAVRSDARSPRCSPFRSPPAHGEHPVIHPRFDYLFRLLAAPPRAAPHPERRGRKRNALLTAGCGRPPGERHRYSAAAPRSPRRPDQARRTHPSCASMSAGIAPCAARRNCHRGKRAPPGRSRSAHMARPRPLRPASPRARSSAAPCGSTRIALGFQTRVHLGQRRGLGQLSQPRDRGHAPHHIHLRQGPVSF